MRNLRVCFKTQDLSHTKICSNAVRLLSFGSMEPAPIGLYSEADGRSLQDVFDAKQPHRGVAM